MGQDDQQPLNVETDDWIFSSGISLGALLKKEREKKGFSHSEISRKTRVRPRFLEAIENEDWDLLPAPALAKGFIRSYARALALDEERIVELYGEEEEVEDFPEKFALPSIPKRKKWPFVVGGLLVLLVAVSGFYAWVMYSTDSKGIPDSGIISAQNSPGNEGRILPGEGPKTEMGPLDEKGVLFKPDSALTTGVSAADLEIREKPPTPENISPVPDLPPDPTENKPLEKMPAVGGEVETSTLFLKGHVTERTWMEVSIDGLKSKEYIFGPSDEPEWKAEKGFELLIGNAGGIVLEFNGKKMDNLGKRGQVVRIKLPEDEERKPVRD